MYSIGLDSRQIRLCRVLLIFFNGCFLLFPGRAVGYLMQEVHLPITWRLSANGAGLILKGDFAGNQGIAGIQGAFYLDFNS